MFLSDLKKYRVEHRLEEEVGTIHKARVVCGLAVDCNFAATRQRAHFDTPVSLKHLNRVLGVGWGERLCVELAHVTLGRGVTGRWARVCVSRTGRGLSVRFCPVTCKVMVSMNYCQAGSSLAEEALARRRAKNAARVAASAARVTTVLVLRGGEEEKKLEELVMRSRTRSGGAAMHQIDHHATTAGRTPASI